MTGPPSQFPDRPSNFGRINSAETPRRRRTRAVLPRLLGPLIALGMMAVMIWVILGSAPDLSSVGKGLVRGMESATRDAKRQIQRQFGTEQPGRSGSTVAEPGTDWSQTLAKARAAQAAGRHSEAEAQFLNARFQAEKAQVGRESMGILLDNTGYFYDRQGRREEAIALYLDALEHYRASVGDAHEHVVGVERRIAYTYRAQRAYDDALVHLQAAIDAARKVHGSDYGGIAWGYRETGDIRRRMGDATGAREDYNRALEVARKTMKPKNKLIVYLRKTLKELDAGQGE